MALLLPDPAAELSTIQTEMNRLFNSMFDSPTQFAGTGTWRQWVPAMDLVETDDHYVLRADLPGLSENDVNIEFEGNVLTISGQRDPEHEPQNQGYYRIERGFGAFSRSLTLPEGVDPDALRANFDRGVLEVHIPKPEQRKPRKVAINAGGTTGHATIESGNATVTDSAMLGETSAAGGNGASAPEPAGAGI